MSGPFLSPANGYGRVSPPSSRPPAPTRRLAAVPPATVPPATAFGAEPDRSAVDKGPPPAPPVPAQQALPLEEAADVAANKTKRGTPRKRAAKSREETRAVAVARVQTLIDAGNPRKTALARVAKELGVSTSAVEKWRATAPAPKAAPKARRAPPPPALGPNGQPPPLVLTASLDGLVGYLEAVVPRLVAAEMRRLLASGVGGGLNGLQAPR